MRVRRSGRPWTRSYLLRVSAARGAERYVVQDLRTGERHGFGSEAELQRFLAAQSKPLRLR